MPSFRRARRLVPIGLTERSTGVGGAVAAVGGGIAEEAAVGLDLFTLDVVIRGGLIGRSA